MKMIVITGKAGKIVGTAIQTEEGKPEAGFGGPIAGPDQNAQVIDLPEALEKITDTDELHRELKTYLGAKKKKS